MSFLELKFHGFSEGLFCEIMVKNCVFVLLLRLAVLSILMEIPIANWKK